MSNGGQALGELLSGLVERFMALLDDAVPPDCGESCEVPPPCWYPKEVARISTPIDNAGVARIHVRVRNGGPRSQQVRIHGDNVAVDTVDISVPPATERVVTASVIRSAASSYGGSAVSSGALERHVLWIVGSQVQYVSWNIDPDAASQATEPLIVDVVDQPKHQHEWYEHFYCDRRRPLVAATDLTARP